MAKVTKGFLLGTYEGLTFYLLHGKLCVRRKSTLSRRRVKYSPRFKRTRQSAGELGQASKMASRVYRELTREQKRMVYVLFKKMTGVAKIALKWGKSEGEAEGVVRQYLIEMGVVQAEAVEVKGVRKRPKLLKEGNHRRYEIVSSVPSRLLANSQFMAINVRTRQPQHSFW